MIFKGILALARRVSFGFFIMLEIGVNIFALLASRVSCYVKTVVVGNYAKRVVIGSRWQGLRKVWKGLAHILGFLKAIPLPIYEGVSGGEVLWIAPMVPRCFVISSITIGSGFCGSIFMVELIASKRYEWLKVIRKLIIEYAKWRNPKRVSLSLS